jgi:hypothetical protein
LKSTWEKHSSEVIDVTLGWDRMQT